MATQYERVKQLFQSNPDKWYNPSEVMAALEGVTSTAVYVYVSKMTIHDQYLERRPNRNGTKGFEYKVKDASITPRATSTNAPVPLTSPIAQAVSSRVRWDEDERAALAKEVFRLKQSDKLSSTTYLIEIAQKNIFPRERQRQIRYASDINWIFDLLAKLKSEPPAAPVYPQAVANPSIRSHLAPPSPSNPVLPNSFKLETVKAPVEPTESWKLLPPAPDDESDAVETTAMQAYDDSVARASSEAKAVEPVSVPATEPTPTVDTEYVAKLERELLELKSKTNQPLDLVNFGLDALIGEVASRFGTALSNVVSAALNTAEIRQALTVTVNHQHHHHHDHGHPPTTEEKIEVERRAENRPARPKIGVVTNRADIETQLKQSFPHINFTVTDREFSTASAAVRNCDRVMVMTKFIGHQTDHHIKKAVGDRYVAVNGGTSEIIRILNMLMSSGQIPKS